MLMDNNIYSLFFASIIISFLREQIISFNP